MSVINQMLKDLDERQVDQNTAHGSSVVGDINTPKSSKTTIGIIVIAVLLLNVLGWYIWDMYQENKTLKANVESANTERNTVPSVTKRQLTAVVEPKVSATNTVKENNKNERNVIEEETIEPTREIEPLEQTQVTPKKVELVESAKAYKPTKKTSGDFKSVDNRHEFTKNNNTIVTPIRENKDVIPPETNEFEPPKKSSLSISRKKLSPEKLVKQKIEGAERAILDSDIAKAEKLFEEVLLIKPEHKSARKQLGALWYGRKLFGPAINLLSRGVVLHPKDIDFRLMKARILLTQNKNVEAFNVLNGFSTARNVEYQTLLANTAQLLKRNNSAILAYRQLVVLEDYKGKWWLGLAVALDRNGEFQEAKSAYKSALTKNDLSDGSAQFIRQRLNELGE